jgi:hypothetical protein
MLDVNKQEIVLLALPASLHCAVISLDPRKTLPPGANPLPFMVRIVCVWSSAVLKTVIFAAKAGYEAKGSKKIE